MSEKHPFHIWKKPEIESSTVVIGWHGDGGKLGTRVVDHLIDKLGGEKFAEIVPVDFFTLNGVSVEDNIARLSECAFYHCPGKDLVLLKSDSPRSQWYRFLDSILDVAEYHCHAKEIYVIGSMVFLGVHSQPRNIIALSSSTEIKTTLVKHGLYSDFNYESPPGQRPSLNSVLLWAAQRRGLQAASLWVPIPFYLVSTEDLRACKRVIDFLDNRLAIDIDCKSLDDSIIGQDENIMHLRALAPDVDSYIRKLENDEGLTQEESELLVNEVQNFFSNKI